MKSSGYPYWIKRFLLINIVNLGIYMAAYYFLRHVQIPKFYTHKKYITFGLSLVGSAIVLYVFWRIMGLWWIDEMRNINKDRTFASMVGFITQSVQFYSPALLLLVWESQEDRKKERERLHQLEKEKLQTELKYLKAQLNPHFLFNTLNNLYSYVVANSPKAPDMILKLSAILDYILYKSQNETVSLKEEVTAIENFVGLEKTRYGDRLEVNMEVGGNTSAPVSPLILLSTVENAFKHGASGDLDKPEIKITIEAENGSIHCNVWNTKSPYNGELNDAYKEGIGLSNIQRQLKLIYPERHSIDITETDQSYNVFIIINTET